MAKKVAKAGHMQTKTQPKKEKECACGGKMDWVLYVGDDDKGMRFHCRECGVINRA